MSASLVHLCIRKCSLRIVISRATLDLHKRCNVLLKEVGRVSQCRYVNQGCAYSLWKNQQCDSNLLSPTVHQISFVRGSLVYKSVSAERLWKGVTSVSNAGKKRGRGKAMSKKLVKNFNAGQFIGKGKANMVWPGLNSPIISGQQITEQKQLSPNVEQADDFQKLHKTTAGFRPTKLAPLERGWSSDRYPGRRVGPPEPVGEDKFEGFDSIVLEFKLVFNMDARQGRVRRMSAMIATGNANGLVGFGFGKCPLGKSAIQKAKNRAGQKLMFIERYKEHTVCHDFFCQFGKTKIFVKKKPEGHGLICHRAIKAVCELAGIKDLYAKVEGSKNLQHVIKAFFIGLLQQRTHQEIAEDKGLHLVEQRKEKHFFPEVVASPSTCLKEDQISPDETLDFDQYIMDGRVPLSKKERPIFYTKLKSWENTLKKTERFRNHNQVRKELLVQYGELRNFLTDKYPECRPRQYSKGREQEPSEEIQN